MSITCLKLKEIKGSLFVVDTKLFRALELGIENSISKSNLVRKRDKLATTLMMLKLNPSFTAVSSIFAVDPTTISTWFDEIIFALAELSKYGILVNIYFSHNKLAGS